MPIDSPALALSLRRARSSVRCVLTVLTLLRRRENQSVADFDRAGFDAAGQNAALIKAIDILDRKTQRLIVRQVGDFEFIERLAARSGLSTRACSRCSDAMLSPCLAAMGMNTFGSTPMAFRNAAIFRFDLLEPCLGIILQIHLVDQHGDLADAEQIQQVAMAARLFLDAFIGIDQAAAPLRRWPRR